jgi:predicted signal transduction protein with EAL and GGDEF domain
MAQMRHKATIVNRMVLTVGTVSSAYRVLVCPVLRADGNTMGVLALFRNESAPEFTPHYARLTELLASRVATIIGHSYDALTSLLTRPAFEQRVGNALQEVSGTQRCWSALSIDINRMHVINDNYGMHMGDRVIAQLGELIRTRLPPRRHRCAHLRRPLCDPAAGCAR